MPVVRDDDIALYTGDIPVRINVVMQPDTDVKGVLQRWKEYPYEISLREDFCTTTRATLHTLKHVPPALLEGEIVTQSQCNVCHTTRFDLNGQRVLFHKGLERTARPDIDGIEINDVVVYPDGSIHYYWYDEAEMSVAEVLNIKGTLGDVFAITDATIEAYCDTSRCGRAGRRRCGDVCGESARC